MAATAAVRDRPCRQHQPEARPSTSAETPRPRAAAPGALLIWPADALDISAYRAEAHRLRTRAIAQTMMRAGAWMRGALTGRRKHKLDIIN
jgi:hypothetical protein